MTTARVEYVGFRDVAASSSKKTRVVEVFSRRGGFTLGLIKWYGPWRGYVLTSSPDVVWSPDCLVRVAAEVRAMTDAHRRLVREHRR